MDNKKNILKCALRLFHNKGYDAVGVQEIVDQAGITKPTLYYHFGSKLGLLKSLLEENFTVIDQSLTRLIHGEGEVLDILLRTARAHLDFSVRNREFYTLLFSLFYSAKENEAYQAVRPYIKRYQEIMVEIFENSSDQLGNMNGRQQQFALGFSGIINHYIMMIYASDNTENMLTDERVYSIVHQFMYGIYS